MITTRNGFGNDYHTEVLLHSNTVDLSKTFDDSSYNNSTVTNWNDEVIHSTTNSHFGSSSILLTTANDRSLRTSMLKTPGRDDFCIDFWILMDDSRRTFGDTFFVGFCKFNTGTGVIDTNNLCGVRFDYDYRSVYFEYRSGGTVKFQLSLDFNYTSDNWYHFAAVRYGETNLKLFVDGVEQSVSVTGTGDVNIYYLDYHILYYHFTANLMRGFYIDEWRHSIGNNRWKNNFIVPNRMY